MGKFLTTVVGSGCGKKDSKSSHEKVAHEYACAFVAKVVQKNYKKVIFVGPTPLSYMAMDAVVQALGPREDIYVAVCDRMY